MLTRLEAAIREVAGYARVRLELSGDLVTVTYDSGARQRVDITADNKMAMMYGVIKKIMW